jgi:hypothetical protein
MWGRDRDPFLVLMAEKNSCERTQTKMSQQSNSSKNMYENHPNSLNFFDTGAVGSLGSRQLKIHPSNRFYWVNNSDILSI